MMALAGVTTALDMSGPVDSVVEMARDHGVGLNLACLQYVRPGYTVETTDPWLCEPLVRTRAIENIALAHSAVLGISKTCYSLEYDDCLDVPGGFGVQVTGQLLDQTFSMTQPLAVLATV